MSPSVVGERAPRRDAAPKVRGTMRYGADLPVERMLHARLVLAAEAHARIVSIDAEEARSMPGVFAVLTADDLPYATTGPGRAHEPLAREEVVYSGQPVALVIGETEAAAADGVEGVIVDLEPLEAVVDLEAAMAPGGGRARIYRREGEGDDMAAGHADVSASSADGPAEELSDNVHPGGRFAEGDVAAALAASAAVVRRRFETSWIHQGYIETPTTTAWVEPDGELVVWSGTQGIFNARDQLSKLFGLPVDRVRVRGTALGGSFGGKFSLLEPLVAGAALAVRRPVRLTLTRSEDMAAANPAPAEIIELEAGAAADGTFTGIRARVLCDRGSSDEGGLEGLGAMLCAGPYRWEAFELAAYGVETNRVTWGAYRAPTAPPAAFAIESAIDELAEELEIDPIELRLRNAVVEGDRHVMGRTFPVMGVRDCLERVRDHPLWARRGELPEDEGIGIALGFWPGAAGPAAAVCRLDGDGRLTVITGTADMSGVESGFATIAAEAFGVDPGRVRVVSADTGSAPFAGASGGSKITFTIGRAVQRAAERAREQLLEMAGLELEIAPEDLEIVDGKVQPAGVPTRAVPIEELASKGLAFGSPYAPVEGHASVAQPSPSPSNAAHISHVRVDRETGEVELLGHVVAQDVGRALNPALVEGQMRGGTTQGFGWALWEELVHDEGGQLVTGSLMEYALPTSERVPPIETEIVEVPSPDGPFGAKGIGEAPVVAVAGAVANAIAAATGVRMGRLPMTPRRVWRALNRD